MFAFELPFPLKEADMTIALAPETNPIAVEIGQLIETAHRSMTQCKADLLEQIRLFDLLELATECGARTTAQFLMRRLGISASTAHELSLIHI